MAQAELTIERVDAVPTRSGKTRFVLVADDGREFSTFREEVARSFVGLEGRRVRLEYHDERRGDYTNVYVDRVEPVEERPEPEPETEEAAWKIAVDAAPYLLSGDAVAEETPARALFEKLRRFKDLVADDLRERGPERER